MAVREPRRDDPRRDGPPDPRRGCHLLQALPGLSRGPAGGRRDVLPGAARRAGVRGAHPRPRRERRGHRRPGEAGPGARRDGAAPPRAHAPAGDRGGGDRPGDRDGDDGRRAALRRPPLLRRGPRARDRGARPGPAGPRRDLPAVPLPVDRGLRPPGLRGGAVRDVAAAAGGGRPGGALARPGGAATCRSSPPTTARSPWPTRRAGETTSRRSRTAPRGSRRG